jgi:twitching motility protein PilT
MARDIIDYLKETVARGGSDLHLSTGAPPCARIHGHIVRLDESPLDAQAVHDLVLDTLTETQRATLEQQLELDYALQVAGIGRFRGNVHHSRGNVEAAFRFISQRIPEIEQLGHHDAVLEFCKLRGGLILVTGVTGSGKSTTLASMVKRISDTRSGVIVTLEDPIEFIFEHSSCLVKQREIGGDSKSFPIALRQALRQDPDVIVVSEMRDLETIRIALTAAETGHLVLATLHTADAPQTIDRLVDVFPAEQQPQIVTQLSACLQGIICQRLIPRADGKGRVLASEVLVPNHALRNCIRERKIEQIIGLMEIGHRDGNRTIDQSILSLLDAGLISHEEAVFHAREPRTFEGHEAARKKKKSLWG